MSRPKIFFAWYDFWVGFFWDRSKRLLYICPLPMVVICLDLSSACWWRLHRWSGWTENLSRHAVGARYRQCERCLKVEVGE